MAEPPFDLVSDMLFALALAPVRPLRETFPGVPFLALGGRTLLLLWFSRIREVSYTDAHGRRQCERGEPALYHELNVLAVLRGRAFFVPAIYATSRWTIHVGHTEFGMPKQPTVMHMAVDGMRIEARLEDGARRASVEARLLPGEGVLGRVLSRAWPHRAWPTRFPGGGEVRAELLATPAVVPAWIRSGRLELATTWLPNPACLLPLGLYAPRLRMRLPRR